MSRHAPTRRAARAFTLSELMVSVAVVGLVLSMVATITLSQKSALQGTEQLRVATESGKDGLLEIERHLRLAGFGVDPRHAFDFLHFRCTTGERLNGPNGRPTCRDRRDDPDRLVFLARSPNYRIVQNGVSGCGDANGCPAGDAWRMSSFSGGSVNLAVRGGDRFVRGQTLLAVCPNGFRGTMGTVENTVTVSSDGTSRVKLFDAVAGRPTYENDFSHPCFTTGATVFQVDRYAYWIRVFAGTPWLILDRGLDLDGDGNDPWNAPDDDDLLPLAPHVEDLQVAYVMQRYPGMTGVDTDANFVLGDDGGATAPPEEPDPSANAPLYRSLDTDLTRRNLHPANIRAVRVSLAIRSESPDQDRLGAWTGDPLPRNENSRRALSDKGRYRRFSSRSTVTVRNLVSKGMFVF